MRTKYRFVIAIGILLSGLACQFFIPASASVAHTPTPIPLNTPLAAPSTSIQSAVVNKPVLHSIIPSTDNAKSLPIDEDVVQVIIQPRETTPIPSEKSYFHPFEIMLLKLINAERREAGLEPLILSTRLSRIARAHSEDMAGNDFFSHTSSSGLGFGERMASASFTFTHAAENLFAGNGPFDSPEAALNAWIKSSAHHDNMFNPVYTVAGIGYSYNADSSYGGYYTIDFAAP